MEWVIYRIHILFKYKKKMSINVKYWLMLQAVLSKSKISTHLKAKKGIIQLHILVVMDLISICETISWLKVTSLRIPQPLYFENYTFRVTVWYPWGQKLTSPLLKGDNKLNKLNLFRPACHDNFTSLYLNPLWTWVHSRNDTVKPVCNDHLYNEIYYLWFI